jgi:hypothetical protein
VPVLDAMEAGRIGVRRTLEVLESRALVRRLGDDTWTLTQTGRTAARAALARHAPDDDDGAAP